MLIAAVFFWKGTVGIPVKLLAVKELLPLRGGNVGGGLEKSGKLATLLDGEPRRAGDCEGTIPPKPTKTIHQHY